MTQEQFLSGFLPLSEAFEKEYSPAVTDLYFNALKRFEYADFQRACAEILATKKFMPKIAEFLEVLDPKPAKEDLEARAVEAWNAANEARARVGQYRSVKFDDERIHKTIAANYGDWVRFCLFEQPHGETAEKRAFCETYLRTRDAGGEYPHLKGLTEKEGYFDSEVEKVAFITTRNLEAGENSHLEYHSVGLVLKVELERREALEAKNPLNAMAAGALAKITIRGAQ